MLDRKKKVGFLLSPEGMTPSSKTIMSIMLSRSADNPTKSHEVQIKRKLRTTYEMCMSPRGCEAECMIYFALWLSGEKEKLKKRVVLILNVCYLHNVQFVPDLRNNIYQF